MTTWKKISAHQTTAAVLTTYPVWLTSIFCFCYQNTIWSWLLWKIQGVPRRLLKRRPILFGSSKIENCPLAQKKWVLHIKMCRILMWIHVIANLRSKFNKEPANDQNVQNFKFPAWSCQNFSTETQNPGNWTRHHFGIHLGNPLCILLLIILGFWGSSNGSKMHTVKR